MPLLIMGEAMMQELQETPGQQPVIPTLPISEPSTNLANTDSEPLPPEEADEIFLNAVSEIPTQPLPKLKRREETQAIIFLYVLVLSFIVGSLIGIITYPTVTIDLVPMSKRVSISTQLAIPTRTLPPVTLSKSLIAPTTGHGHQAARTATGNLTFYNGLFTQQTIPIGTEFSGSDGEKVSIDQSVTIPAGNPPTYGQATVTAHSIELGAAGNIQGGDINTTVSNGVLVKNSQFSGGRDARDFQAVAQSDLDRLTSKLKQQLSQQIPQAFTLRSGEALQTTNCLFKSSPNHWTGEEGQTVSVKASQTCQGIAYNQDKLEITVTTAFNTTRPGTNYQLVSNVTTNIVSVSPFVAQVSGTWVYHLSQDYEQFLAQQIAGDTPGEARKYLLATSFITSATIPTQLPKDPEHIQFQILIGVEGNT